MCRVNRAPQLYDLHATSGTIGSGAGPPADRRAGARGADSAREVRRRGSLVIFEALGHTSSRLYKTGSRKAVSLRPTPAGRIYLTFPPTRAFVTICRSIVPIRHLPPALTPRPSAGRPIRKRVRPPCSSSRGWPAAGANRHRRPSVNEKWISRRGGICSVGSNVRGDTLDLEFEQRDLPVAGIP